MNRTIAWSVVCVSIALLGVGAVCSGQDLVISEIAWAGTAASASDEWLELRNIGENAIDLSGWWVAFGDVTIPLGTVDADTLEARTPVLDPGGFLLLERTDDTTVSDVAADVLYKGSLSNRGVVVELYDPHGDVVDAVALESDAWPAGGASDALVPYGTMERTPSGDWASNDGILRNGVDAEGNPLNGTPGQVNSAEILAQHAPVVTLHYPSEEGITLSGTALIQWGASDPDGESSALAITIFVSFDDGGEWAVLVEHLVNAGSYSWDTRGVASGDGYRLKVRATDPEGYFGEAMSPEFRIADGNV